MKIKNIINEDFIVFDGAMGTMLQNEGLLIGELTEVLNITNPDIVKKIHSSYIESGANIISTNTFGANELKLENTPYSVEEIILSAVKIAKEVAGSKLVALDIGPIGQLMAPSGTLRFEDAYNLYKRQVIIGEKAGADIILIETMTDLYEAKAAVLAAKENSSLPVFCTMTFQQNGRTLMGTDPISMVRTLEGLGVDALGVNCSLGPNELIPIVKEILKYSSIPVIVQANAGLPRFDGDNTYYDISPEDFAMNIKIMAQAGATIFGGCCGTTPDYIHALIESLKMTIPFKRVINKFTSICSSTKTIFLGDDVKIIGERINPTGKKKFKEALKNNDMDYIISEAIVQKEAGADILDVNVGVLGIDEKVTMINAITEIQGIIDIPLQIDSSSYEVLEAAARIYNGVPIINSVNGKSEIMNSVFPIAKKYGACVIGLTLDEKGIPANAEERYKIAERIVKIAESFGIGKENILIDCLVLTASAQQGEVIETLKAVKMVKDNLGVKTVLGVSNVSFGLPQREIINRTFLTMALTMGLDAPILNPLDGGMMDIIRAFKVLNSQDEQSKKYIKYYTNLITKKEQVFVDDSDLKKLIIEGMKDKAAYAAKELLKNISPLEIVNLYIIPALDLVGKKYENKEVFLPQLIQSAETVKKAFEVIKSYLLNNVEEKIDRGKILIATVKGDIHDIGKNIIKVLLESYGFEVIDLGKDVPVEIIVEKVRDNDIKLVGLSALMTTTVKSMEETITALKKSGLNCMIMVGGAVLNNEYAKMIGADFYAKDAQEAVKIANKVLGDSPKMKNIVN